MTYSSLYLTIRPLLATLILSGVLAASLVQAQEESEESPLLITATLESPADGGIVSGVGFISGWKCNAGEITVVIDEGEPISLITQLSRLDTAGSCDGATDNGFIIQTNWNWLSQGEHTAVAYDDGEEFARSTFMVGTTGEEFVKGAMGECSIADFPAPGESATFVWNESTQHLELSEVVPLMPEEEGMTEPEPTDS